MEWNETKTAAEFKKVYKFLLNIDILYFRRQMLQQLQSRGQKGLIGLFVIKQKTEEYGCKWGQWVPNNIIVPRSPYFLFFGEFHMKSVILKNIDWLWEKHLIAPWTHKPIFCDISYPRYLNNPGK